MSGYTHVLPEAVDDVLFRVPTYDDSPDLADWLYELALKWEAREEPYLAFWRFQYTNGVKGAEMAVRKAVVRFLERELTVRRHVRLWTEEFAAEKAAA